MTVAVDESKKGQAAYVAYRTFKSFFEKYEVIPTPVDRSVMKYTSGGNASMLLHAFRALGMINSDGSVTDRMEQIADAYRNGNKSAIEKVLRQCYPTVFELDLMRASPSAIRTKFEDMGLNGETVRKSVAFFLAALEDAGVPFASHLKPKVGGARQRGAGERPARAKRKPSEGRSGLEVSAPPGQTGGAINDATNGIGKMAELPPVILGSLELLLRIGKGWTKPQRDQFVTMLEGAIDLSYPAQEK